MGWEKGEKKKKEKVIFCFNNNNYATSSAFAYYRLPKAKGTAQLPCDYSVRGIGNRLPLNFQLDDIGNNENT